jgi:transcriptional regulator with XRE-family HTH domain
MPKSSPTPPTTLGERLTELRASLSIGTSWSRARVAQEAHVSAGAIARLETAGSGTAANLAALARFYQRAGFNMHWLFSTDTKDSCPYSFEERWADEDRMRTFQELASLRSAVQDPLIQARITMLLVRLLPSPSMAHRSEVDLRQYQRYLPPVVPSISGWRERAFNIPPHHYYVAGESVPSCGAPFEYLTFDSSPERPSRGTTCMHCAESVSLR